MEELKWPTHKDHLNKTFLEELGHRLWNTKGIRFHASERLLTKNDLSNKSIGFLSAYLIIFGLLSVYQISGTEVLSENVIAFSSTTLSILLLVFSQMEAAQDYKIRAQAFHKCALQVSELHDEVRLFKTLGTRTEEEKMRFCEKINDKYQKILHAYPNHESIDYSWFRAKHPKYYEMPWLEVKKISVYYYLRTKLLYHVLMGLPLVVLAMMYLLKPGNIQCV